MSLTPKLKDACRIVVEDGIQYLAMPDGTKLPRQIWTRVTDPLNEPPYAIVKLFVQLDETEK
jgi:hypothetical protein